MKNEKLHALVVGHVLSVQTASDWAQKQIRCTLGGRCTGLAAIAIGGFSRQSLHTGRRHEAAQQIMPEPPGCKVLFDTNL